jgi:hypothetical protein
MSDQIADGAYGRQGKRDEASPSATHESARLLTPSKRLARLANLPQSGLFHDPTRIPSPLSEV